MLPVSALFDKNTFDYQSVLKDSSVQNKSRKQRFLSTFTSYEGASVKESGRVEERFSQYRRAA